MNPLGFVGSGRSRDPGVVGSAPACAHDVRSAPLASLRAAVEIALAHPDDVAADEALRHVLAETDRLQGLGEQLLTVSRALSVPPEPGAGTEPATVVERVLADYPAHDIDRVHVTDHWPTPRLASIAPADLHRVLRNLLDNALRHAATGVRVDIDDRERDLVVLAVTKDGADPRRGAGTDLRALRPAR